MQCGLRSVCNAALGVKSGKFKMAGCWASSLQDGTARDCLRDNIDRRDREGDEINPKLYQYKIGTARFRSILRGF
jgi:hypothetical protein